MKVCAVCCGHYTWRVHTEQTEGGTAGQKEHTVHYFYSWPPNPDTRQTEEKKVRNSWRLGIKHLQLEHRTDFFSKVFIWKEQIYFNDLQRMLWWFRKTKIVLRKVSCIKNRDATFSSVHDSNMLRLLHLRQWI